MVDFGILQTPDYAGALQRGIDQGRTQAKRTRVEGALASYQDNPDAAEGALVAAGAPEIAVSLGQIRRQKVQAEQEDAKFKQQQEALAAQKAAGALHATDPKAAQDAALAAGNVDFADALSKMDDNNRQATIQHLDLLNNIATRIAASTPDPVERARRAQHIATVHPELGIKPEEITPEGMTDQSIATLNTHALKAKEDYTLKPGEERHSFDATGKETVSQADFAPEVKTLGPGESLVQTRGGPAAAVIDAPTLSAGLVGALPGVTITSGTRTPAHNAEVGGVANSQHLDGHALDIVLPKGTTPAQVKAYLTASGIKPTEFINEGDHLHVAWGPKGGGGAQVIASAPPKATPQYRAASPAEVAAAGLPVGTPAQVSPEGKIEPFTNGANLKPIPSSAARGMADTTTAINKIDGALKAVNAYPQGLGLMNHAGDAIRQRADPNGVDVRAAVADIGSQIIHDRSGAAVTISETPRLVPFIPNVNDAPATVIKKLNRLKANLSNDLANTQIEFGPDSGYRQTAAPVAAPQAGQRLSPAEAQKLPSGTKFIGQDGKERVKH